jgi:flagellar hook-length control protein FliK
MDTPGVQIKMDPVAPPEAPKSRDVEPGKKRDEQGETKEAAAAATALTVSFADILRSKKQDIKTGAEEREKTDSLLKTKPAGRKEGEDALLQANGQLAAGRKRLKQPAIEVQAKETLDHAKELAGAAMKAAAGKGLSVDSQEAVQSSELSKKGSLTPAEEALLNEMIQKNGNLAAQKKAAQMTGFVNGEPLTRREGIGAIKSMTAKEGEILKNLSGGEEAEAPKKFKAGKSARTQQPFVMRDTPDGGEKAAPAVSSADAMKQEFAGLAEGQQDKLAAAGSLKKQGATGGTNPEVRDVPAGAGMFSVLPGRGIDNAAPARPQAVMSQVLDGATQILREGSGRVTMTLQPPRLGTLDLDVVVQDNRVKMVMLADNQEVKQMLQAGMDDLRNALQDKGFQIDRLEVLVQNRPDDAGSNFWQEAGFGREDSAGRDERKREQESVHAAHEPPARPLRTGDSGISVFA